MLLDLDLVDLAWVLDYVAENELTPLGDAEDCVVRAARRLIEKLKDQMEPDAIAEVDDMLTKHRPIRWPVCRELWMGDGTRQVVEA